MVSKKDGEDMATSQNLAHDLSNADVWRSTDISYQDHHVEIITPNMEQQSSTGDRESVLSKSKALNPLLYTTTNSSNTTFSSMKINPQIVDALKRCGFTRPSPIQSTALPLGRLGIDLIAQSKSGTGKTLVFVVCALEMVLETLKASDPPTPRALIVAPTREIALQIGSIIDSLTAFWSSFTCYKAIGGTKVSDHLAQLATSSVVVGTPGRICCLLEMGLLPASSIRLLVLDECDKLMEESFKRQIDKLYGYLPASKQMIVTSATLTEPMTLFLARYMTSSPALVRLSADSPALVGVHQLLHRTAGHALDYLNFEGKIAPLLAILRAITFSQAVLFSNYQTRAKYLLERLLSSGDGWTVALISGDMTQKERAEAIASVRRHRVRLLVSTDLTARGIDVESVNLVVNLDVPLDGETYLHRIGRAGRFGSAGLAITLVGNDADMAAFSAIQQQYRLDVTPLTLPIIVSPWATFYERRLQGQGQGLQNTAQLLKPGSAKSPLAVNELFADIVANIADLQQSSDEEENVELEEAVMECSGQANITKQSWPVDANHLQAFIASFLTLTSASSQVDVSLHLSLDDQVVETVSLNATSAKVKLDEEKQEEVDSKECSSEEEEESGLQLEQLPSVNLSEVSADHVDDSHLDQVHVPPPFISNSGQRRHFKNAFLRPIAGRGHSFASLMPSNVSMCKYLLQGCCTSDDSHQHRFAPSTNIYNHQC